MADPIQTHAAEGDNNLTPVGNPDAITALDALAAEEAPNAIATHEPGDPEGMVDGATNTVTTLPPSDTNTATTLPPADTNVATTLPPAQTPEEKAAADKLVAKEEFDKVELPPHTKPKTAEAFATIKEKARQTINALRTDLDTKTKALEEVNQKLTEATGKSGEVPAEITTELEELRKFKLAHDVESDPTFRTFDASITENNTAVLKKLKDSGITDDVIEKVKEIGITTVDWDKLLAKFPSATKRYIEAKLVENETLVDKKAKALESAKTNAKSFLTERESRQASELIGTANGFLKQFPFTALKQVPADAKPEDRTRIEAENKEAQGHTDRLKSYLGSYSPKAFAELAVGTMLAYKYNADLKAQVAKSESLSTQLAEATKKTGELQAKLDRIKQASAPRTDRAEIRPAVAPKVNSIHTDAGSALDALADEARALVAPD